jgi:hypothetical protein
MTVASTRAAARDRHAARTTGACERHNLSARAADEPSANYP